MTRLRIRKLSYLLVLAACIGCAAPNGRAPLVPAPQQLRAQLDAAPTWAKSDCRSGLRHDEQLCAVGVTSGIGDLALARRIAEMQARAALAGSVSAHVQSLTKDYRSNEVDGRATAAVSSDASRQVVDETVRGARLVEIWISEDGTVFALVAVHADTLAAIEALYGRDNGRIEERAAKAFRELDERTEHVEHVEP